MITFPDIYRAVAVETDTNPEHWRFVCGETITNGQRYTLTNLIERRTAWVNVTNRAVEAIESVRLSYDRVYETTKNLT